ncbi:Hypothetical predicted protein, partial [Paramuricea clavata]
MKETPHEETLPSENTCECGKEIGSKSDEDIVKDSGILSLAQVGDRWHADKGFMVQRILDAYGVIVDTPEKLSNKK